MMKKSLIAGVSAIAVFAAAGALAQPQRGEPENPLYVPDPSVLGLPAGTLPEGALPEAVLPGPLLPGLPQAADLPEVPVDVIQGLIEDTPAGRVTLDEFIRGVGQPDAQGTSADRALAVIYELRNYSEVAPPTQILAAADTVMEVASALVCPAEIVCIEVQREYQPPAGAIGFDFGGPETPVQVGFERVTAADPRLSGNMTEITRPGGHPLMHDGIIGVREMRFNVPPGEYRVIFVTDSNGTQRLERAPFGEIVYINGFDHNVEPSEPSLWPFIAWFVPRRPDIAHTGGAMQLRTTVNSDTARTRLQNAATVGADGVLDIVLAFKSNNDWDTYLTALVLENTNADTTLDATQEATTELVPPEQCLFLDVLVADLLQGIAPAAGPADRETASPN